jgi:hypothetical protein
MLPETVLLEADFLEYLVGEAGLAGAAGTGCGVVGDVDLKPTILDAKPALMLRLFSSVAM